MKNSQELYPIPLTIADIDAITFALRQQAKETHFAQIKMSAEELIEYLEREKNNIKN